MMDFRLSKQYSIIPVISYIYCVEKQVNNNTKQITHKYVRDTEKDLDKTL